MPVIKWCIFGVNTYYGMTIFYHSMGDMVCYILYVLNFNNWEH